MFSLQLILNSGYFAGGRYFTGLKRKVPLRKVAVSDYNYGGNDFRRSGVHSNKLHKEFQENVVQENSPGYC